MGRPHGLDGTFAVLEPRERLEVGTIVTVAGRARAVESLGGTDKRPLVRLEGVDDRDGARALGGELLLAPGGRLTEGEWLAADLIGCSVDGGGSVRRVIAGPSCDVLELDDGTLVPLVADAVKEVDPEGRRIEIDRAFLGMVDQA